MWESKLRNSLHRLNSIARRLNDDEFIRLLEKGRPSAKLVDLGCGSGQFTLRCADRIATSNIWGVDVLDECLVAAETKGIVAVKNDLNKRLDFSDDFFDVAVSNQVIEHLIDIDTFVKEIYRILKPNGYAVISTVNLASWHNIWALLLGWAPFAINYSMNMRIGNPLNLDKDLEFPSSQHIRAFTTRVLREFFEERRFHVESLLGAGHYPMPTYILTKVMSKIDPRHAVFLTVKVRK